MTINDFHNKHQGESAIICGLGPSIKGFIPPEGVTTIGVNDIGRHFTPDYLVCVDKITTFNIERRHYILHNEASWMFSYMPFHKINKEKQVLFKLGTRITADPDIKIPNIDNFGIIDYTQNSTFMAVILAYQMGFKKIGLLGVDLTDHITLTPKLEQINREYAILNRELQLRGVHLLNLSKGSKLITVPKLY